MFNRDRGDGSEPRTTYDRVAAGPLTLRVSQVNGAVMIEARGELDLAGAPALARQLERARETSAIHVRLDLRGLEFIDSAGIRELVRAKRDCDLGGSSFVVVRGSGQVAEVTRLAGLDGIMEFVDQQPDRP